MVNWKPLSYNKYDDLIRDVKDTLLFYGNDVFNKRTKRKTKELMGVIFVINFLLRNDRYFKEKFKIIERQYKLALRKLLKDNTSRQALITFWSLRELCKSEPECLISYQVMLREGKLHMFVYERSWDFVKKFHQDIAFASHLAKKFCEDLEVGLGDITFFVGSLHA